MQSDSAGKVSMLLSALIPPIPPPVITSPAMGNCMLNKQQMVKIIVESIRIVCSVICHGFAPFNSHQLGNCLLGRWWLGQRGEGETSPS